MTYWYLASPYSLYIGGRDAAFRAAANNAALLLKHGVIAFSPIVHTHPLAEIGGMDPLDHNIWLPADQPFMQNACGCIMLKMTGWQESKGMAHELAYFEREGMPIVWMEPGKVPAEFLKQE